jgi:hypothetical protein
MQAFRLAGVLALCIRRKHAQPMRACLGSIIPFVVVMLLTAWSDGQHV